MSFVRPEVKAAFWRWREALAGLCFAMFGLWMAIGAHGITEMLGFSVVVAGVVVALAGMQRARFRSGSGGPGLVEVLEGQITYFGPTDGGTLSIQGLTKVELDQTTRPAPSWILTETGQPPLTIPTNAEGSELLFDVFASLDGIRTERMLSEMKKRPKRRVVIWQARPHGGTPRLARV